MKMKIGKLYQHTKGDIVKCVDEDRWQYHCIFVLVSNNDIGLTFTLRKVGRYCYPNKQLTNMYWKEL